MAVRILVVDNSESTRRNVKELLRRVPYIEVVGEAADGLEAVRQARRLMPDLVIMDVGMPRMNGLAATELIKNEMPAVQVIMLTVYDLPEYEHAAAQAGASGYVVKTSLYEELLPAIARVMNPGNSASPAAAQARAGIGEDHESRGPSRRRAAQ